MNAKKNTIMNPSDFYSKKKYKIKLSKYKTEDIYISVLITLIFGRLALLLIGSMKDLISISLNTITIYIKKFYLLKSMKQHKKHIKQNNTY